MNENKLEIFVAHACVNRDRSHDYSHMQRVAINSNFLAINLGIENDLVNTIAWIHDIIDHKYDDTSEKKLCDFLLQYYEQDTVDMIIDVVESISYSTEKKNPNIRQVIKDKYGENILMIRDIVSDGDKLDALGKKGIERCMDYVVSHYPCESYADQLKRVMNHICSKFFFFGNKQTDTESDRVIFVLKEYIRTSIGKAVADILYKEMFEGMIRLIKVPIQDLGRFAGGLNVEGGYPYLDITRPNVLWVNLIVVLDRPLIDNVSFTELVNEFQTANYPLLENTVEELNEHKMFSILLLTTIYYISKFHKDGLKICIIFHQPSKYLSHPQNIIRIFDDYLNKLINLKGIELIYMTDDPFYIKNAKAFDTDILISFSQCAGLDPALKPGDVLVANTFIPFDVKNRELMLDKKYVVKNDVINTYLEIVRDPNNEAICKLINTTYVSKNKNKASDKTDLIKRSDFIKSDILQVNDLWNPTIQETNQLISIII